MIAYLKGLHEGWTDEIHYVLDSTPAQSVEQRDLYDRWPEFRRSWADGSVVLVGDAVRAAPASVAHSRPPAAPTSVTHSRARAAPTAVASVHARRAQSIDSRAPPPCTAHTVRWRRVRSSARAGAPDDAQPGAGRLPGH